MVVDTLQSAPWITRTAKALILFGLIGLALGFCLGTAFAVDQVEPYLSRNELARLARYELLGWMVGSAGVWLALGGAIHFRGRGTADTGEQLHNAARRLSPLALTAFLPILFHHQVWRHHELTFLVLVACLGWATWTTAREVVSTRRFGWESRFYARLEAERAVLAARLPQVASRLPLIIVIVAAASYFLYFAYYTIAFFYSVRSGYDLALENNLMWNLVHGGPLFKSSPLVGPVGTHFGYHATLFAFVMAPIYILHPYAETLLVLQSAILGGAAIPLYFFARRHIPAPAAAVVSLAYLLYPSLHGANLFEFHYLPLGPFFLWMALCCLESKRDRWAIVFIILTLSVREDVSAWVALLGAYLILSGRRPHAGMVVASVGAAYFVVMKFLIMPRFAVAGDESFTFIFKNLIPAGQHGFGAVMATVIGNPGFTLTTLVTIPKLIYGLHILVPIGFLPLRTSLWPLLVLPGFLFTLLSTDYSPTISITYQYGAHFIAFLFPAAVLALGRLQRAEPSSPRLFRPAIITLGVCAVASSHQFGAILQQDTAMGGPVPYVFGVNAEGQHRHDALAAIEAIMPKDAKVSCSAFTTPPLSSRPDAYSMTLGLYDAEYIVFPTVARDYIGIERKTVTTLLREGTFGVVALHPPFALAKRGHSTELNQSYLSSL